MCAGVLEVSVEFLEFVWSVACENVETSVLNLPRLKTSLHGVSLFGCVLSPIIIIFLNFFILVKNANLGFKILSPSLEGYVHPRQNQIALSR